MKSRSSLVFLILLVFVIGAAVPTVIVWNPAHWGWATRLVPMNMNKTAAAPGKKQRKIKYWRGPMNPNYISNKPGKSPMGMDLVPVYADNEEATESGVHVSRSFLQDFSVRTAVVKRGSVPIEIRTLGILIYNDKNITSVNTKFEGWIEKAYVNYVGEPVKKGQILFEIYSPQLVTTQQEYLTSVQYLKKLENGGIADAIRRARSLVNAARERLHYWDITDNQIDGLKRSGKLKRTLKILSPVSGIVIKKMDRSLEGMKLVPGMNVYKIADLSTVWAQIEVYEYHLRYLHLGQRAQITVDAFPGRRWTGKLIYLDPTINPRTRTLKAYVQIPNPDFKLRPQMYANVVIHPPAVFDVVKIPEEAVLHTGERNVVIVRKKTRLFEPRDVQLGATGNGYVEVRHGLKPGEVIVTSSQFLIDSESNLREAVNKMLAAKKGGGGKQTAPARKPANQQ